MAKATSKETVKQDEKLMPEITQSAKPQLLNNSFTTVHIPGHYLLEQPDGVLINVTPAMYKRVYEKNPDFQLKKSPNQ